MKEKQKEIGNEENYLKKRRTKKQKQQEMKKIIR